MIKKIKIGINNLYLFENEKNEFLLLDTGKMIQKNVIFKKLNNKIGDLKKIKVIVISHSHSDHIGNLKKLIDELEDEITVISHEKAKEKLLSGIKVIPDGTNKITIKISNKLKEKQRNNIKMGKIMNDFPKIENGDLKKFVFLNFENYEKFKLTKFGFKNLELIYTEGHSEDSISLILNKKYLFCGDLIQNILFKKPLIPLFANDLEKLFKNWKKVINENYEKIYPATGKIVFVKDLERVIKKYEKYKI